MGCAHSLIPRRVMKLTGTQVYSSLSNSGSSAETSTRAPTLVAVPIRRPRSAMRTARTSRSHRVTAQGCRDRSPPRSRHQSSLSRPSVRVRHRPSTSPHVGLAAANRPVARGRRHRSPPADEHGKAHLDANAQCCPTATPVAPIRHGGPRFGSHGGSRSWTPPCWIRLAPSGLRTPGLQNLDRVRGVVRLDG
jgi:hypothetical protein